MSSFMPKVMRSSLSIISIFVFAAALYAQGPLPVITSNSELVSIQDGPQLRKNAWRLAPEADPDIYEAQLLNGKPQAVTFITDVDKISFTVEEGKSYDFIIRFGGRDCVTRIIGKRFIPAATFDDRYRKKHKGRTFISVPEAYEMVNVAIALTPTGIADKGLVYQNSDYYKKMREWFEPYRQHKLILRLEAALKQRPDLYFSLKMNGYSFDFDPKGRIVRSKVYDRTGFSGERSNSLLPFLDEMQSFADASNFREFYKRNKATYQSQTEFFEKTADLAEMKRWLDRNFPGSSDYDTYKIIFSPLVAYNQSVTWFESNGFRELQPHVNFPYAEDLRRNGSDFRLSPASEVLFRGNIVFTEMNHGYINPEADKYAARITKAVSNRDHWVDAAKGPGYYPGMAAFNEYMNWALVSLRIADYAPENERMKMIEAVERMMTKSRGFKQFAEFDRFLLGLYTGRRAGQTLAELYPQIIEWFEIRNAAVAKTGGN